MAQSATCSYSMTTWNMKTLEIWKIYARKNIYRRKKYAGKKIEKALWLSQPLARPLYLSPASFVPTIVCPFPLFFFFSFIFLLFPYFSFFFLVCPFPLFFFFSLIFLLFPYFSSFLFSCLPFSLIFVHNLYIYIGSDWISIWDKIQTKLKLIV